jgi:hypothetical protein
MIIHEPIDVSEYQDGGLDDLMKRTRETILAT